MFKNRYKIIRTTLKIKLGLSIILTDVDVLRRLINLKIFELETDARDENSEDKARAGKTPYKDGYLLTKNI
jgi:hypothetical protein